MKYILYNQQIEDQIKAIRKTLRLRMNGEVSENMTNKGCEYKLNYGALLPELKSISQKYTPHKLLAERLWRLRIRETMILATYLYPVGEFTPENASCWIRELPTKEIAEILTMNLLSKLSFAEEVVQSFMTDKNELTQLTSWLLLTRIGMKIQPNLIPDYTKHICNNFENDSFPIRQSKISALKSMAKTDKQIFINILPLISHWQDSQSLASYYNDFEEDLNFYFELTT